MDDVFCNIACCPLSSHCGITPKSIDKNFSLQPFSIGYSYGMLKLFKDGKTQIEKNMLPF